MATFRRNGCCARVEQLRNLERPGVSIARFRISLRPIRTTHSLFLVLANVWLGFATLSTGSAAELDMFGPAELSSDARGDERPAQSRLATSPADATAPTGNPLWAVAVRELSATRDRPIFSSSRRPPKPPAAIAQAPPPPAQSPEPEQGLPLSILGTVVGRGDGIGVFMEHGNKNMLRLRAGQYYAGWVLRVVARREATFEKGLTSATLTLPSPGDQQAFPPIAGAPLVANAVAQVAAPPASLQKRRHRE
jgi:general secretion pathway protein N